MTDEITVDVSQYRIRDAFTGATLRIKTSEDLRKWLIKSYATLTPGQRQMIDSLEQCLIDGDEYGIKWYGVACDLNIEPRKKRRKKRDATTTE